MGQYRPLSGRCDERSSGKKHPREDKVKLENFQQAKALENWLGQPQQGNIGKQGIAPFTPPNKEQVKNIISSGKDVKMDQSQYGEVGQVYTSGAGPCIVICIMGKFNNKWYVGVKHFAGGNLSGGFKKMEDEFDEDLAPIKWSQMTDKKYYALAGEMSSVKEMRELLQTRGDRVVSHNLTFYRTAGSPGRAIFPVGGGNVIEYESGADAELDDLINQKVGDQLGSDSD